MNIKNLIIGVAIFILTVSVGVYGVTTLFGSSPDYNKYCPQITNYSSCIASGGTWTNYSTNPPVPAEKMIPASPAGYCDNYNVCNEKYQAERLKYNKKVFLVALPVGIALIIAGAIIFGLLSVGGGLMAGGVGIVIYGVFGFWEFADNWIKFILSLIALGIIIWLAYYLNKKLSKKK